MIASLKSRKLWNLDSQTAKNILQKYGKKVYPPPPQKKTSKNLSAIEDRKVNTKCLLRWKSFVTWQIQCRCYGGPGGFTLHLGLLKLRFLEHHGRQGCPTFFSHGPDLLFPKFRGPKFSLWDSSSKKIVFLPKIRWRQKKRCLQPTNSNGFSGVLQRRNKIKMKDLTVSCQLVRMN